MTSLCPGANDSSALSRAPPTWRPPIGDDCEVSAALATTISQSRGTTRSTSSGLASWDAFPEPTFPQSTGGASAIHRAASATTRGTSGTSRFDDGPVTRRPRGTGKSAGRPAGAQTASARWRYRRPDPLGDRPPMAAGPAWGGRSLHRSARCWAAPGCCFPLRRAGRPLDRTGGGKTSRRHNALGERLPAPDLPRPRAQDQSLVGIRDHPTNPAPRPQTGQVGWHRCCQCCTVHR